MAIRIISTDFSLPNYSSESFQSQKEAENFLREKGVQYSRGRFWGYRFSDDESLEALYIAKQAHAEAIGANKSTMSSDFHYRLDIDE